jgi:hypothetical protein
VENNCKKLVLVQSGVFRFVLKNGNVVFDSEKDKNYKATTHQGQEITIGLLIDGITVKNDKRLFCLLFVNKLICRVLQ